MNPLPVSDENAIPLVPQVFQPHRAGWWEEVRVVLRSLGYLLSTPWRLWQNRGLVDVRRDIPYVPGSDHPKHKLDLFLPPGERHGIPFVLFIHGGYWREGDRRFLHPVTGLYSNIGEALARAGIGVAVISYRLMHETGIEGQLEDVARATAWLFSEVERLGGSRQQVVLAGHSAGGHLACLLRFDAAHLAAVGVRADDIAGLINLSGVIDVDDLYARQSQEKRTTITDIVFGRSQKRRQRFSPTAFMQGPLPPMLTVLGDKDYPEIYAQTQLWLEGLKSRGEKTGYVELQDHTHEDIVLNIGKLIDATSPAMIRFVKTCCSPGV